MEFTQTEEYALPARARKAIAALLSSSFSTYPAQQSYYKQVPSFRILAWEEEQLVGHLAVEHRLVNNSGTIHRIFGVADLCVAENYQSQGLASALLTQLENLGKANGVDFLVLLAKEPDVYLSNGFEEHFNKCKWLWIHRHQTLGVAHRTLSRLMVKALGTNTWKQGTLDFLGHIF